MAEPTEACTSKRHRIFLSYSRADRQRVLGLLTLLEGLNHRVFMDQRSIPAGKRWKEELEKELNAAEVLLVFWTRHAVRSEWVRHEYETFAARFPERPLVPVVGDQTPLIETLKSRQISDFFPLINELFAMVRDLDDRGISKREIRAAVFKRLEEEGIHLPPKKRNRLFGLFGIVGVPMASLYFLEQQRDVLMERASRLPSATFYAASAAAVAGTAAVAGYMTCHSLGGLGGVESITAPDLFPVRIHLDQSGNAACDAEGMICVSVARGRVFDINRKFFGYLTPPCSATVRRTSSCPPVFDTDFEFKGVVIRRSPDADEGVQDLSSSDHSCLTGELGKHGLYDFANCVKP